ncbi:MAG: DNA polymerase III subunit delta [Ginsengibacter sp.]
MTADEIIKGWRAKQYRPVYWFEGEEDYYIDKLIDFAEKNLLPEEQRAFNQSIFYGRDAAWADIVNACSRYPMFGERQIILLKEAQLMKDIEKLEFYISNPLSSTIFIVAYKGKNLDKRGKLSKIIARSAVLFQSKKIPDEKLMEWISGYKPGNNIQLSPGAAMLLADHLGNDLNRIANEIEKVLLNIGARQIITEDDIEQFVGISKEYNVFELQNALGKKDLPKAISIIQYFGHNPKAGPIQLLLPSIYGFFSKILQIYQLNDKSYESVSKLFYFNSKAAKQAIETATNFSLKTTEQVLLLLHHYNLKSIGIDNGGISDADLMKELASKIILQEKTK